MKNPSPWISVVLSLLLVIASQASFAAQRMVLLESFTNTGCGPCASANPITHTVIDEYGTLQVLNVQYHMSWPSASDPFYTTDATDCNGRRVYYAVNAVPDLATDGVKTPEPGNADGLRATLENRLATDAPLEITVGTETVGDQMTVTADITAVDDVPATGLVVRIALVEPHVHYASAPGSNGETDFYCSMRNMLPSHAGTSLTIANGQTVQVVQTGTLDAGWTDVYAVVWVQDDGDKSVLQAASSLTNTTDYAFFAGGTRSADVAGGGTTGVFDVVMSNLGLQADSYGAHLSLDVPADWQVSVCQGTTCYPPWVTDISYGLDAGEQTNLAVDINVGATVGVGTATLDIASDGDPTQTKSLTFKLIHAGTQVLCVDDDGGYAYETYYQNALTNSGRTWAAWDLAGDGKVAASQLANFDAVVWNVGLGYPSLDITDRAALADYLDGGGNLFVSGQDIGWDMCDADGYSYSTEAIAWYHTYLGTRYVRDDTNDMSLLGIDDDPISDGLSFNISGGNGANNQSYPSEIQPYGDGVACLLYSADREAGVHTQTATWRSVYFAFGFEGIATDATRNALMRNVLDWFNTSLTGIDDGVAPPTALASLGASPNPFNPTTRLSFRIDGNRDARTEVNLYGLDGRKVRTLYRGTLQPGTHSLTWDGHADDGRTVASGVYLARVRADDQQRTVKLTLTK